MTLLCFLGNMLAPRWTLDSIVTDPFKAEAQRAEAGIAKLDSPSCLAQ